MEEIQEGIFSEGGNLYTVAASDEEVYGENFVERQGESYRRWHPDRSKAGAAVKKDMELGLDRSDDVLYLGAASGTTVSHFSDILRDGFVFAVEYSDTVIRDLVHVAEDRKNIAPILANARNPEEYLELIGEKVDVVFQDISQRDQAEILIKNAEKFLQEDGTALLAIKARSVSSSRDAEEVFDEVKDKLRGKFDFVAESRLDPHEKDHLFLKMELSN
jgi:fibrillarin-like pre-rRNA processing protein